LLNGGLKTGESPIPFESSEVPLPSEHRKIRSIGGLDFYFEVFQNVVSQGSVDRGVDFLYPKSRNWHSASLSAN